jgi:hypothetical protein
VTAGDEALGIGDDRSVVEKHVHVVLRRVDGVDQVAQTSAQPALPVRQRIAIFVSSRASRS